MRPNAFSPFIIARKLGGTLIAILQKEQCLKRKVMKQPEIKYE
jgi:hypothetical protein